MPASVCPHCQTPLWVKGAQLDIAQGFVMCSYCEELFQASKHFIDMPSGIAPGALMPALTGIKLPQSINPKTQPIHTLSSYRPKAEAAAVAVKQQAAVEHTPQKTVAESAQPKTAPNAPAKQQAAAEKAETPAYALNTLSSNEITDLLQDMMLAGKPADKKTEPAVSKPEPEVSKPEPAAAKPVAPATTVQTAPIAPVEPAVAAVAVEPAAPVVPVAAAVEPAAPVVLPAPVAPTGTSKEELNWTLASLVALTVLIMQLFYLILLR